MRGLPPPPAAATGKVKVRSASDLSGGSGLADEDRAGAENGRNIFANLFGDGRDSADAKPQPSEQGEAFRAREAERLVFVVEALKVRFCIDVAASVRLKAMLREEDSDEGDGGSGGGGGGGRRGSYR